MIGCGSAPAASSSRATGPRRHSAKIDAQDECRHADLAHDLKAAEGLAGARRRDDQGLAGEVPRVALEASEQALSGDVSFSRRSNRRTARSSLDGCMCWFWAKRAVLRP